MGTCSSEIDETGEIANGKEQLHDIKQLFTSPMSYEDHLNAFPDMTSIEMYHSLIYIKIGP